MRGTRSKGLIHAPLRIPARQTPAKRPPQEILREFPLASYAHPG